jgi:hypothetical protein
MQPGHYNNRTTVIKAGMPYRAVFGLSGTGMKKLTVQGPVPYRNKAMLSVNFWSSDRLRRWQKAGISFLDADAQLRL